MSEWMDEWMNFESIIVQTLCWALGIEWWANCGWSCSLMEKRIIELEIRNVIFF